MSAKAGRLSLTTKVMIGMGTGLALGLILNREDG